MTNQNSKLNKSKLKPGQVLKRIISKNGKEVIIKIVEQSDWRGLMHLVNSVVEEKRFLRRNKKVKANKGKEIVKKEIEAMKEKKRINICAISNSRIIGHAGVERKKGFSSHIGKLGIIIDKNFREERIGTELMGEVLKLAKDFLKLKMVVLGVFEVNKRAIQFYKKFGFKNYGKMPKAFLIKNKYINGLEMYKDLS